jgi:non-ribosomal peptide synthase protein (TIGR01720 family)
MMNKHDYIQRIQNLTPQQRELLASQLSAKQNAPHSAGHQRLVAYVASETGFDKNDLTAWLKSQLPEYMVPARIVRMDEIPRLPNGKIDLNSLPEPDDSNALDDMGFAAPKTAIEQKLAAIWEEVLNFEPVGVHDNFFEIGGDSILSIQIVARARKAGLLLKPTDIFEHQTIAGLALFARQETGEKSETEEFFAGEMPLLPIQHWFFDEHKIAPGHWNQGFVFKTKNRLDTAILEKAVRHIVSRHEALRSGFIVENGKWNVVAHLPEEVTCFTKIDQSHLTGTDREDSIRQFLETVQQDFNLSAGGLFQAVYFEMGEGHDDRFYLLAHHLVVDHVSWQIIIEELQTAYSQMLAGQAVSLPSPRVSLKKWGEFLLKKARSEAAGAALDFWKKQHQTNLPFDVETSLPVPEASVQAIDFQLDEIATADLLSKVPDAYNTKTDEILTAILVKTLCDWSGGSSVCTGLERHGRDTSAGEPDPSGLVGWLTVYFPLTFHLAQPDDWGETIKYVKEKIRQTPGGGGGYGQLRYLAGVEELNQRPPVIFNFLGQQTGQQTGVFGHAEPLTGGLRDPRSERFHCFEINALVANGRLKLRWEYSEKLHREATVRVLVESFEKNLRQLIAHCAATGDGGYTPSDFPEADLNQEDLDKLLGGLDF